MEITIIDWPLTIFGILMTLLTIGIGIVTYKVVRKYLRS